MKLTKYIMACILAFSLAGCINDEPSHNPITYGDGYITVLLSTDKAAYQPGEPVQLSLNNLPEGQVTIRYKHLNKVLSETPLTGKSWSWNPPADDFKGYMVDLYTVENGEEVVLGSIAIDVSSDPARFPRNGFLSEYGAMSEKEINKVMDNLNRHHINYVQYQDWHYKHHKPLAGSPSAPMDVWKDIINRDCYRSTVQGYIDASHKRGMKSLFYNLAYGALSDAADDGVKETWYLFKDKKHGNKDYHPLGSPFKSNIYLTNPALQEWRDYMAQQNNDVYEVFDFDGYQIDQLGGRGELYDYNGNSVDLAATFPVFIKAMKEAQPEKSLVMNAVGQYGQENLIANSPVDFLYTEVWEKPTDNGFSVLSNIITNNDRWSNGKKTVLAAYMNYKLGGEGRGYFNTPGVLMANAAIHAWGGAHLELGEHMLTTEYFPNSNLAMKGELKKAMVTYYDFITGYENLLRDGGEFYGVTASSTDGKMTVNQWPPVRNQIATIGKCFDCRDVIHFLNYTNAVHLDWCDSNGTQAEPSLIESAQTKVSVKGTVRTVWATSPDVRFGVSQELDFVQEGNEIKVTLPSLKYWTMLVIDYE